MLSIFFRLKREYAELLTDLSEMKGEKYVYKKVNTEDFLSFRVFYY